LCAVEARSISDEDLVRETAQLLGYKHSSAKIDMAVKAAIEVLRSSGRIVIEENVVRANV
jgi:hypothetical protein